MQVNEKNNTLDVQHVFLVGAKSLGAYGGYETFVDKLTEYHQHNEKLCYHVACKANGVGAMDEKNLKGVEVISKSEYKYHNARCFKIKIPPVGPVVAVYYDLMALKYCCSFIRKHKIKHPIIYIMACRIGPFSKYYYKKVHQLGGRLYLNPDGHEWLREKWSPIVRRYWKYSEKLMVENCDLVVCDSINIERYIEKYYKGANTTYIAYGAETRKSNLKNSDSKVQEWYQEHSLETNQYYLVVGRFVPENNYETMIREYMKSKTSRYFAIITNVNEDFLRRLEQRVHFSHDARIKFVGTVYDKELLKKIRENAYGYFHGHEVGGTNPSLLEALGSTKLNLLLDVGFNREVAEDAALYWTKQDGNLAELIDTADCLSKMEVDYMGKKAKNRVRIAYSWQFVCDQYEKIFCLNNR